MTPELQRRLEHSLPPFDGSCIHNTDTLTLYKLRELLLSAIAILEPCYPEIRMFHDWHEHDGFIVESEPASWVTIHAALATDETLFNSRDDDFAVRIAFHPPNLDWLLRYNIDPEDQSDYHTAMCDFDLTIARDTSIQSWADSLISRFPTVLERNESKPWFQSKYGG
jgi:hypothetical protein